MFPAEKPFASIVVPAHNEERILKKTLANLLTCDTPETEILVGLDGCTDSSEAIVDGFPRIRKIKSLKRIGKSAMLSKLAEAARGEVLWVLDADHFLFAKGNQFSNVLQLFKADASLGGIIYPMPEIFNLDQHIHGIRSRLSVGDNILQKYLVEFRLEAYSRKQGDGLYFEPKPGGYPMQVHVWRKKCVDYVISPCDDSERALKIVGKGYRVRVLLDESRYAHASPYPDGRLPQKVSLTDIFKQKTKNQFGWRQLNDSYGYRLTFTGFYLPFAFYVARRLFGQPRYLLPAAGAIALFLLASVKASLLRLQRATGGDAWGLTIQRREPWQEAKK